LGQQKDLSDAFVMRLADQMQDYRGPDVEALIVGVDENGASIYFVDEKGTLNCASDVGFAAIGLGSWHARSRLMQAGYVRTSPYIPALAVLYTAKKNAEIAPGVGKATDINLVFRGGVERLKPDLAAELDATYNRFNEEQQKLAFQHINQLQEWYVTAGKTDGEAGRIGSGETTHDGTIEEAAEAARGNEGGEEEGPDEEARGKEGS
jgi:hypothetical protein